MKKSYQLCLLLLISIIFTYEPTTLNGKILDINNKPINAVYILSESDKLYSDKDGNFRIFYNTINEVVHFKKIGYKDKKISISEIKNNNLVIILEVEAIKLNEIKVSGLSGDIKLQKSTQDVHIITSNKIAVSDLHFQDIINDVPNLNYSGATSRPRYFQIRGIGELSQYAGESGPNYYVATVIDDIDISGIGMPIFLDDINQIEVFQGPQSYAYGHNAMAGLIHVKTKDPTSVEYSEINTAVGNDELFKISLQKNFKPMLDNKLLINQFAYYSQQNGFLYNNFLNDYKNNKIEFVEKIKLLYRHNNISTSKLTLIYSNLDNGYDAWSPENDRDTTYSNSPGKDSQEMFAFSLKNESHVNGAKITNITNYLNSNLEHSYDSDWANDTFWEEEYEYVADYDNDIFPWEFRQIELRERSMVSNDLRYNNNIFTIGLYYQNLIEDDNASGWLLGGLDVALKSKFTNTNHALYAQFKEYINNITVTLNLRYEENELDYQAVHTGFDYYTYNEYLTLIDKNTKDKLFGFRISILDSVDQKNVFYTSISSGYKAGGVNQDYTLADINTFYEPEKNVNLDFGWRYIDKESAFNINLFYMDRTNIQINLSSQNDGNPNTFYYYTANASNGYNYGLNFDYTYDDNNFNSYIKVGLLKSMINAYDYTIQDVTINNEARESAHAPAYTYSVGLTKYYKYFYVSIDFTGKDAFYYDYSYNEKSKPYSLLNSSIGFKINDNTKISIWAKNVLNKKYSVRGFYFSLKPIDLNENGNYYDDDNSELYESYGEPLTIGLNLKYNF